MRSVSCQVAVHSRHVAWQWKRLCQLHEAEYVKLQDRVPIKGLRERLELDDNLGTTAKQVAMVWACAVTEKMTMIG